MANSTKPDFRLPTGALEPRAVVDVDRGFILAAADVKAPPQRIYDALTTAEVERWWRHPDYYHWSDWNAELRVGGRWSVTVNLTDGSRNKGWGEMAILEPPHTVAMTRVFEQHPLLDQRETTLTYRMFSTDQGTRIVLRDEGFVGRIEAAFGNAEHWERVFGWLRTYFEQEKPQ